MRRGTRIALAVVVTLGVAVVGVRIYRGPSGASRDFGGSLEAMAVPDFSSLGPERWVNGSPTSLAALRGNVVLIEAWHPT